MDPLEAAALDDYTALTTGCGLVDVTQLRDRIELTGDDRHAFLHNFCTNDIRSLPDGAGCEAFLLDAKGHVLFYVFIRRRPERLLIDASAGRGAALIRHLDKYLIREKVSFRELTAEWHELLIAGTQAAEALSKCLGCDVPTTAQASVVGPGEVVIVRHAWTPEANFCVLGPAAAVDDVRRRLTDAGVRACGVAALETLRIEVGLPQDGIDIGEKNLAQEIDRNERTLHFRKGCYLGQETVARLDALGHVNKRLVGLRFSTVDAAAPPTPGTTFAAGQITSAAFSPRLKTWIALAYIRESSTAPGTVLETPLGPAEAVSLPFVG